MKSVKSYPSALNIAPKYYRHFKELNALRESLLQDHADRMSKICGVLERAGADGVDTAEQEIRHAMALGMLTLEDDALFEIDSAIERILDGSYGRCEMTGKPIPEERLRVVPWTRYTKDALEKIERESRTTRSRLDALRRPHSSSYQKTAVDVAPAQRFFLMIPA